MQQTGGYTIVDPLWFYKIFNDSKSSLDIAFTLEDENLKFEKGHWWSDTRVGLHFR